MKFLSMIVFALSLPWMSGGAHGNGLWSKEAITFEKVCYEDLQPMPRIRRGTAEVSLTCRNASPEDAQILVNYRAPGVNLSAELLGDDDAWRPQELLWAPDGRAFAISGSGNAYAGFDLIVIRIEGARLIRSHPVLPARRLMIGHLATCWPEVRAAHEYISPELDVINMSAIAWKDASTLAVFAEVIPSSNYGAAMGQAMGFEIDVRDGRVQRQMTAAEFKKRWQAAAGWQIRIPEQVDCGPLYWWKGNRR